jgi:hypothetical protein
MKVKATVLFVSMTLAFAAHAGKKAPFPGLHMASYTAPDKSFSMYYPRGWTATPQESGITFAEDSADDTSAHIDVFVLQFGEQSYTTEQIVGLLSGMLKQQYPSLKIVEQKQLAKQPDIRGVMFSYQEGKIPMSGFGLVLSAGKAAIWSDIYGKDAGFVGYNPVVVLSYVMQSLAAGPKPNRPQIQGSQKAQKAAATPPRPAGDAETQKKIGEAAVMTHFWNNAHYIVPDAFSTYVPPMF